MPGGFPSEDFERTYGFEKGSLSHTYRLPEAFSEKALEAKVLRLGRLIFESKNESVKQIKRDMLDGLYREILSLNPALEQALGGIQFMDDYEVMVVRGVCSRFKAHDILFYLSHLRDRAIFEKNHERQIALEKDITCQVKWIVSFKTENIIRGHFKKPLKLARDDRDLTFFAPPNPKEQADETQVLLAGQEVIEFDKVEFCTIL